MLESKMTYKDVFIHDVSFMFNIFYEIMNHENDWGLLIARRS